MKRSKPHVGWREWLSLPDLGVAAVKAKVDTGARTSALHAWDVALRSSGGVTTVEFVLHPMQRSTRETIVCSAVVHEMRTVRNSGGDAEERPVIVTTARLAEHRWPIEIALARRDTMGFRMLLGRSAVRGRFVVDPGRSYLLGPRPERSPSS